MPEQTNADVDHEIDSYDVYPVTAQDYVADASVWTSGNRYAQVRLTQTQAFREGGETDVPFNNTTYLWHYVSDGNFTGDTHFTTTVIF
ncbi:hypothetical protein K8I28_17700 [bacterium]|nr:hypothetical protein [bacterium]